MPTVTSQPRRAALQRRPSRRTALLLGLPLTTEQLAGLFDYLQVRLRTHRCDDTLGHTRCFAAAEEVAFGPLQQFLGQHGGRCDCAVLAKVQPQYETIL